MLHKYKAEWLDYNNVAAWNMFHAASLSDAVDVMEDLVSISAASWVELKEDGIVVTPGSSRFNQPATADAIYEEIAELHTLTANTRSPHVLRLHAVLPTYVDILTKVTTENPFRELRKLRTIEDEPLGAFVRAKYQYRNRRH